MKRILLVVAGVLFGLGVALTVPASAGTHDYPTPSVTPTQLPVTPTPTPTQPLPTPTVPVVNPFAGCVFSATFANTFDPFRGRFIRRLVPAIVCDRGARGVFVYDLVR